MKPSILLVDDVEANLVALEAVLGGLDCHLVRASNGNEALRQLLKREHALMLLDVQMPGMDGYEVASLARQNPGTRDVPIVFLTATPNTEENVLQGYGAGAVDFLHKPFNPHVLRAKVGAFLELFLNRKKLEDEVEAHRKTLAALQVANQALRHFTNAASHDLRAPLRSVRGFLSLLAEESSDRLDEQNRDYLDRSLKASIRMDSLLDSLLRYAGLGRPIESVDVDCNVVLAQARTDLTERLIATRATLEADALPTVRGDADRLYQLFLNLIGNALKFQRAGEPAIVRITVERRAKEWVFCVADNGIGIEAEFCAVVFDAFRRLHTQAKYEGSGLGLAICQQIVEQHGGRIWVESQLGVGAQFSFALPA